MLKNDLESLIFEYIKTLKIHTIEGKNMIIEADYDVIVLDIINLLKNKYNLNVE